MLSLTETIKVEVSLSLSPFAPALAMVLSLSFSLELSASFRGVSWWSGSPSSRRFLEDVHATQTRNKQNLVSPENQMPSTGIKAAPEYGPSGDTFTGTSR